MSNEAPFRENDFHWRAPKKLWDETRTTDGKTDYVFSTRARNALESFDAPEKVTLKALLRRRSTGMKTVREIAELFKERGFPKLHEEWVASLGKRDAHFQLAEKQKQVNSFRESAIRGWTVVLESANDLGSGTLLIKAREELASLGATVHCTRCGAVNPEPVSDCPLGAELPGAGLEPHILEVAR